VQSQAPAAHSTPASASPDLGKQAQGCAWRIIGSVMPQGKRTPEKLNWERLTTSDEICAHVLRSKVPGGWLVYVFNVNEDRNVAYAHGGLTFYPDPKHKWNGASLP
jgi:hypothetical protein